MSLLTRLARRGGHRRHRLLAQRTVSPFISGRADHQDDNEDTNSNCNNGMHQQQLQRRTISIASQRQLHRSSLCHQSSMNSSSSLLGSSSASFTNNNHMSCTTARAYHTTPKNQILPFLAVGVLGASAVYTYRTFQQMDQDWDDYYEAVEEYKAMTGIDIDPATQSAASASASSTAANTATSMNGNEDLSAFFTGGTMAIDLGTTRLKLSHRPSLLANANNNAQQLSTSKSTPSVSVDREGFRSTPSLLWMPLLSSQNESCEEVLTGRLAQARMYDTKNGLIVHPREALLEGTNDVERAIESSIRVVASNALDQALGGTSPSSQSSSGTISGGDKPLFVLDASMAESSESYNVRPIFTYPPQYEQEQQSQSTTTTLEEYKRSMNNLTSPAGIAEFVSEPVAIVTGAEYYNLLPPKGDSAAKSGSGTSVLVIDVGGSSTCISMVNSEDDTVMYSTSLPFGGDTFIDLLVSHLVQGFYNGPNDTTATAAAASEEEASDVILSTKPNLNDATALQRLYESSTTAIHELSNKTRSEINIPYLTMDLETRQPKHLEVGMARTVVNGQVEGWVRDRLVPHLQQHTDNSQSSSSSSSLSGAAISQALPPPTNLSTLVSSTIMSSLESTSQTPHDLRAILLVGGGARIPLVREAVNEGVSYLAGDSYANGSGGGEEKRLIMPEGEMGEELAVLGAVVWGSGGR